MFRLLPWSSGIGGNKVMGEDLKMLAAPQQCRSPRMDNPSLHKLKRKRVDSSASESSVGERATTKPRLNDSDQASTTNTTGLPSTTVGAQPEVPTDSTAGAAPSQPPPTPQQLHNNNVTPAADTINDSNEKPAARPKIDIDKLRETIDAQLSLEVLLKHNELRLIDQEIAKCQVALEQLRRCAEIPYPGSSISGGVSQSVSNGTGVAVLQPGNGPAPLSPAPWGVTDGPYSRHYAKWLIPDPRFDGGEVETPPATAGLPSMDGRATRGSLTESGYVAGKSRSQRGSGTVKLQALSSGYPQPKEKAGPMIIKRKSDGQFVKLVCLDCRRDNFSSTQGFINHCRIAHNRNFASHDAAAMASGEPVEVDEAGTVVGGNTTESTSGGTPGYVHPLIRSAHVMESMSKVNTQRKSSVESQTPRRQSQGLSPQVETKKDKLSTPAAVSLPFTASPDTPHLSSLMQRRGIGLNLSQIVGDAKTSLDLDALFSDEESSDSVTDAAPSHDQQSSPNVRASRLPARTTMPQTASQRPSSRKGQDKAGHGSQHFDASTPAKPVVSYASSFPPTSGLGISHEEPREMEMGDPSVNLSPNTVESNQAPSLVSDDDEYEAASESESPSPSSSDGDDDIRDFSHIEVEDGEDTTTTTTETKTEPGLASPARRHAAPLSKPLKRGNGKKKNRHGAAPPVLPVSRGKDEKRVSFASPETSPSKTKGDGGRKQRR